MLYSPYKRIKYLALHLDDFLTDVRMNTVIEYGTGAWTIEWCIFPSSVNYSIYESFQFENLYTAESFGIHHAISAMSNQYLGDGDLWDTAFSLVRIIFIVASVVLNIHRQIRSVHLSSTWIFNVFVRSFTRSRSLATAFQSNLSSRSYMP